MSYLVIIWSYLIGSIPTAYFAGQLLRGKDIRQMGDGNVGARNAYLELGAVTGIIVGLIDGGKGILTIILAQQANVPRLVVLAAGLAAVAGHNWPVFLGLRGGRGVSTTIGILLVLLTGPILVTAVPALIALFLKRDTVFATAVLFVPLPLVSWWFHTPGLLIAYSLLLMFILALTHFFRTRSVSVCSEDRPFIKD